MSYCFSNVNYNLTNIIKHFIFLNVLINCNLRNSCVTFYTYSAGENITLMYAAETKETNVAKH